MARCVEYCTADLACVSFNINKTSDGFECGLLGEIWEENELLPDENMDFWGKEDLQFIADYIRCSYLLLHKFLSRIKTS